MRYEDRPMLQISITKYDEMMRGRLVSMRDPSVSDDGRLMYTIDLRLFDIDGMAHIILSDMPKTEAGASDAQKTQA